MESLPLNTSAYGSSVLNTSVYVCEITINKFQRSSGIFFGDNPLKYTLPVIVLQTSIVALLTAILQFVLAPYGVTSFFPHLLAGLIMGPSVLGQIEIVRKYLFPPRTFYINDTISFFGSMMYMFLIGVKIDLSSVVKALKRGKRAWAIGTCSFIVPLILSTISALVLRVRLSSEEENLYSAIIIIAPILSTTSFHVTATHLADLKLLNSEIGRIGGPSAMVGGTLTAILVTALFSLRQSNLRQDNSFSMMMVSLIVLVIFIVCVLRPIMFWMIRRTPKGKPIKESYILSVFLMLLGCSFFGEFIGEHFMVGPILLGLAVPDGPPLASALVEKLDTLVSAVFLPLYFLFSGSKFKVFLIDTPSFALVQLVAFFSFLGKVIGTTLPALYCKLPLNDALCLGLIMSARGVTELLYFQAAQHILIMDGESYGNVVIAMLWMTGVATPLAKYLHDPSKRYLSHIRKRNIEHTSPNAELRLMACIHCEENSPSIINILEMSNPTEESPICLYVLHLIQLTCRAVPLLIDHQPENKTNSESLYTSESQHIINAFRLYEEQNPGKVVVKIFTSISPNETMHDEICIQAADKRVSMLIIPFHKQRTSNGFSESALPVRALNHHLLSIAPCSVGILVERGTLNMNSALTCVSFYSVGVVFIEGPDDREALVYAMRMAERPNVRVTVIRLVEPQRMKNRFLMSWDSDGHLIHKFKVDYIHIKRHDYREEIVRDSLEVINVVRSLEGCFDLILVGRRHASESSSLFSGLTEWNEYPELGFVGDMLVSSVSTFDGSVLVVQQQKLGAIHHDEDQEKPFTIVEMPHDRIEQCSEPLTNSGSVERWRRLGKAVISVLLVE
ncbi:hypothetical protein RIF29_17212 [Crotalaria pallida]|uniref:Cation/H+ exchanger domain-containing protein n=1 Tax=Crotalaria pallida TaxID=3830 RepID=A0AAN9FHS9_CROPI